MTYILNIDTSTSICSVSLSEGNRVLDVKEDYEGRNHAKLLTPFIEEILKENNLSPNELSAVSVSKGPGSYTGLRIGVSVAKGIAYALSIPLISVDTLLIMASGYLEENKSLSKKENVVLCPMIDARRMEVYSALFDSGLSALREVKAEIIDENSYRLIMEENQFHIFGDGASKCAELLQSENLIISQDFKISSRYMAGLSAEKFEKQKFEDVAYFEPFYLKDFIATTPKNKVF